MDNNIKRSTQILAVAPLLLLLISKIVELLSDSASEYFVWSSYIATLIFTFHLLLENKKNDWVSLIVLVLILLGSIGSIFKIMHWPFVGVLLLGGLLGTLILACLFLYNAIKDASKHIRYEQLILSLFVFIQFVLGILGFVLNNSFAVAYGDFLYYPIAALSFVVVLVVFLKKTYVNWGERNLMLYLLVQSSYVFIKHLFEMFS